MATATLTEQVGAMAVVDELRHRQMVIQEELDLPKRRADVAQRLREFYSTRNIEVDDATIDQGVTEYFSHRLQFEAPALGRVSGWIARAHIARQAWMRPLAGAAVMAVLVAGIGVGAASVMDNWTRAVFREAASGLVAKRSELLGRIERQEVFASSQVNNPELKVIRDTASDVMDSLRMDRDLMSRASSGVIVPGDYTRLNQRQSQLAAVRERLDGTANKIYQAEALLAANKALQQAAALFDGMPLPAEDKQVVVAMQDAGRHAIEQGREDEAKRKVDLLTELAGFAKAELTLKVVDRSGEKSGVERRYNESGGKTWYAIVEAVDASGEVFPVYVHEDEQGQQRMAREFGVQITREAYLELKEDKMNDGHVDNNHMGDKPANSLAFHYVDRVAKKPNMILEW